LSGMAVSRMLNALRKSFDEASLRYCDLHGLERDEDWVMLKLLEEVGELTQVWNTKTGRGRNKGMSDAEIAYELASDAAQSVERVYGHGMPAFA